MALPRRWIVLAATALAAGAYMYMQKKRTEAVRGKGPHDGDDAPIGSAAPVADAGPRAGESPTATRIPGSQKELSLFLAGESWYDEVGWRSIWAREGIASPTDWLRLEGREVLRSERKKLAEHPALLAGCRRRWIVVCRYAGIDVGDAASIWSATEQAV